MSERKFEWGGLSADHGDFVTATEALAMSLRSGGGRPPISSRTVTLRASTSRWWSSDARG